MSDLMPDDCLIDATRAWLALDAGTTVRLEPILKGGSERTFHRVNADGCEPLILMRYSAEKQENTYWADLAQFLDELGVRVPRIRRFERERGLIWIEDLGTTDLHAGRDAPWEERRRDYAATLDNAVRLHRDGLERARSRGVVLMPGFDTHLYAWERNYFFERFVHGVCQLVLSAQHKTELDEELTALADDLMRQRPALVHRDFQSQNVLIKEGEACFIDFQGMREGTAFYDLGSLLYDPYVTFAPGQREELLRHYFETAPDRGVGWERFVELFHLAAAQRLMQALGAYGFLGRVKERPDFLAHIPAGLRHLRLAAAATDRLPRLLRLVDDCEAACRDQGLVR